MIEIEHAMDIYQDIKESNKRHSLLEGYRNYVLVNNIIEYLEKRIKDVSLILANNEDHLEISTDTEKIGLKIVIEHGRAKIDELIRLKKEFKIN